MFNYPWPRQFGYQNVYVFQYDRYDEFYFVFTVLLTKVIPVQQLNKSNKGQGKNKQEKKKKQENSS